MFSHNWNFLVLVLLVSSVNYARSDPINEATVVYRFTYESVGWKKKRPKLTFRNRTSNSTFTIRPSEDLQLLLVEHGIYDLVRIKTGYFNPAYPLRDPDYSMTIDVTESAVTYIGDFLLEDLDLKISFNEVTLREMVQHELLKGRQMLLARSGKPPIKLKTSK